MRRLTTIVIFEFLSSSATAVADPGISISCHPGYYPEFSTAKCEKCRGGFYGIYGANCKKNLCHGDLTENCTGPCDEGYFCPPGSKSATQQPCGAPEFFCPKGSSRRIKVKDGYYSTPVIDDFENKHELLFQNLTFERRVSEIHRSGQKICEPSYFCLKGRKYACSDFGSFGISKGLMSKHCNGICPAGYYCLPNIPQPIKCPAGTYGNRTGETRSSCEGLCSPGYYCPEGSISPNSVKCRGGIVGIDYGLTNANCSKNCDVNGMNCIPNLCERGYFCEQGSISFRQEECGGEYMFCPEGSSFPKLVTEGYYSVGDKSLPQQYQMVEDSKTRYSQVMCEVGTYCRNGVRFPCPAGKYSNSSGSTSCLSNNCQAGFFCPPESSSPRQKPCGSSQFYCPEGSREPVRVPAGFYTVGGNFITRTDKAMCEPGFYCIGDGIKRLCPAGTFGSSYGLTSSKCDGQSLPGYYTPEGSTSADTFPCPAGRYGLEGMEDELCMGVAMEGFYTHEASNDPTQNPCGGDMYYCPEASSQPTKVSVGYFSIGGTEMTRSSQQPCESYIDSENGLNYLLPTRPMNAITFWCPFSTHVNSSSPFPWIQQ